MSDDAERWNRVKQVFQDALELPAAERGLFLRGACGADRELRGEVESLLLAHTAAGSFAQGPAVEALPPSGAVAFRDGEWAEHRLQRGARLGHYEILSAIGEGGMGEVYRARDAKLGRDVAIKILPRIFTSDPDRLARFEREARLLASLNHPNIGAIYGLEDVDGIPALVLELVEGDTLAERLGARPGRHGSPKHVTRVGPACRWRSPHDRAPDRRRARGRAREGHRPPRPEAREHQDHAGRRR